MKLAKIFFAFPALFLICFAHSLAAQTPVAPPPKPGSNVLDAANAEILTLLQAGMPESVVLEKIRTTTEKFNTSATSLIALKKAGANEAELKAILAQGNSAPVIQTDIKQQAAINQTANAPSLEETMKFIQEELNANSTVNVVVFYQNSANGSTWNNAITSAYTDLNANSSACRIEWHFSLIADGDKQGGDNKVVRDNNSGIHLKTVHDVVIKPFEQYLTELDAKTGNPQYITLSTSPSITVLVIHTGDNLIHFYPFTDPSLADRVAKAITHAVELCGGGSKEPF
jgi:hypothetical protein